MEALRKEKLNLSILFTFFMALVVLYAAIWSLDTSLHSARLLTSSLSMYIWIAGITWFIGAALSLLFYERSTQASSWILCLFVTAGIYSLLIPFSQPYGVVAFLLPLFYSILLFDIGQMSILLAVIMAASTFLNLSLFPDGGTIQDVLRPELMLLVISLFILITSYSLQQTLEWYVNNYYLEKDNRQTIRDNEIELLRLVKALKIQQEYLKNSNELLAATRDEAERSKIAKQVFVENVSHELLSPLNMIIGFAEAMLNTPGVYGEVNWTPELKSDVDCIHNNSRHLKSLIDDVLRLAALENNSFQVHAMDFNLSDVIDDAVQACRDSFLKRNLFINVNQESHNLFVRADEIRIKQVVLNLLSNSLKATSKGGVTISTYRLDGMAYVSVEDTGKGIPEYALDKIFEAFFQVDKSSSPEESGTGLGLSISKMLVEQNGGEIRISSMVGEGTTISFTLPLIEN